MTSINAAHDFSRLFNISRYLKSSHRVSRILNKDQGRPREESENIRTLPRGPHMPEVEIIFATCLAWRRAQRISREVSEAADAISAWDQGSLDPLLPFSPRHVQEII